MKKLFFTLSFLISSFTIIAQHGTIRGTILDVQSEIPLIGATIELVSDTISIGEVTDVDGSFVLSNVPIGRTILRISYLGYESLSLPNIDVTTGKDVMLTITLQESYNRLDEVVISANVNKDHAQNELATISARQFSVEEINRYAGGRSDVARQAANFAGVSAPDDSRNDIVIRGNSPTGVLWRIEGIPTPNPNHFGTLGTTGSPVAAINPNVLRNSDFLTSAFPAEYGNALAGVFDIGFRNGNKDRAEYTLQIGAFSGLEGMAEGPFGERGGSYLVAGRYSFISLVGAGSTAAVPNYQDLSFKIDFGQSDIGRFTLFGIGGRSDIDLLGSEIDETDLFAAEDEDSFYNGRFGVIGLKYNLILSDQRTYIRTIVGGSLRGNSFERDRYFNLGQPDQMKLRVLNVDNSENRLTFSSYVNSKLSARQTLRAGVLYERYGTDASLLDREETPDLDGDGSPDWLTAYDFDGSFGIVQPFVQTKYRLTEGFSINAGLHGQYSSLSGQFVLEPRTALTYVLHPKHQITLGYGMHHQTAPLPILFLNEVSSNGLIQTNIDLDFIRSQHFVLGYDIKLGDHWRLKTELYHQNIDRVPIQRIPTSYSTLTEGADFGFANDKTSLINDGTGFNRGIEVTLEKFYSNGFHILMTTSIFESKYKGSDGVERSTPFDNRYVVNLLGGKEWSVGKNKNNKLVLDTKLTSSGGRWFTPIDLEASRIARFQILKDDQAFTQQYDGYLRWDFRIGMKFNSRKKKISHQFYFDLQNITNRENIFARQYNRLTNSINQVNQLGLFPDFLYRIQF